MHTTALFVITGISFPVLLLTYAALNKIFGWGDS